MLRDVGNDKVNLLTLLNQIELVQLNRLCAAAGTKSNLGILFQTIIALYEEDPSKAEAYARGQLAAFRERDESEFRSFVLFLQEFVNFVNYKNQILKHLPDSSEAASASESVRLVQSRIELLRSDVSEKMKTRKAIRDFYPTSHHLLRVPLATDLNADIESINRGISSLNERMRAWGNEARVGEISRTNPVIIDDKLTPELAARYLQALDHEKRQIQSEIERLHLLKERYSFASDHANLKVRIDALKSNEYEHNVFEAVENALRDNIKKRFVAEQKRVAAISSDVRTINCPAQVRNVEITLPIFSEISVGEKSVTDEELIKIQDAVKKLTTNYNAIVKQTADGIVRSKAQLEQLSAAMTEQGDQLFLDDEIKSAVQSYIASSTFFMLNTIDDLVDLPSMQYLDDDISAFGRRLEEIKAAESAVNAHIEKVNRDKRYAEFADILIRMYSADSISSKLMDKFKAELILHLSTQYPDYTDASTDETRNATIYTSLHSKYKLLTVVLEKCDEYERHLAKENNNVISYQDLPPGNNFKVTLRQKMKVNADIKNSIINAVNADDAIKNLQAKAADQTVKYVLTANRDGFGTRLLKGILLVLSFGQTAKSAGLWKSHGAMHAEKLESIVNPAKGHSRS